MANDTVKRHVVLIDGPYKGCIVPYMGGVAIVMPVPSNSYASPWNLNDEILPGRVEAVTYRLCEVRAPGRVLVGVSEGW